MTTTLLANGQTDTLILCDGAPIDLKAGAPDSPKRFQGIAYSGGIMKPQGMGPVVVDLTGVTLVAGSRPILRDHDDGQVVGHSEAINVGRSEITVAGVVSGTGPAATEVLSSSRNGFPWKLSIGAADLQFENLAAGRSAHINGRTFTGPLRIVRKATLHEISFVSLPGDFETSVQIAAKHASTRKGAKMDFEQWLTAKGFDPDTLNDQQRVTLRASFDGEQGGGLAVAIRDDAVNESRRLSAIHAATADFPQLRAKAIGENWSLDQTELAVLRAERDRAELNAFKAEYGSGPSIHVKQGRRAASADVLQSALLCHVGREDIAEKSFNDQVLQAGRDMRATSIDDIGQACCRLDGVEIPSGGSEQRLKAAFSTTSLPGILGNTANKISEAAYSAFPSVAKQICRKLSASDFKQATGYRIGAEATFEGVAETGEIKHGQLAEQSFSYQIGTYGKMFGLTRQAIIGDDLGALSEVPNLLGRGAAVKLENLFWAFYFTNASSFIGSGNSNYFDGADSALSATSLATAVTKLRKQTDPNGDPISITPRFLVVSPELESTADGLYSSLNLAIDGNSSAVVIPTANTAAKKYTPAVTPYLSNTTFNASATTTQWLLVADPADIAAWGLAFLNGREFPVIEQEPAPFNTLGIQWRGYHDFGVAQIDYRGVVKSKGSA